LVGVVRLENRLTVQLRFFPHFTKGIKQLLSRTKQEYDTARTGHPTYRTWLVALLCCGLFTLDSFLPLPLGFTWLLRIVAFASFGMLLILLGQQTTAHRQPPRSRNVGLALRESELHGMLNNLPVAAMVSRQTQLLWVNEAGLQLAGWQTLDDALGHTVTDWLPRVEQRHDVAQHLATVEQGTQSASVELSYDANADPVQLALRSTLMALNGAPAVLTLLLAQRAPVPAVPQVHTKQPVIEYVNKRLADATHAFAIHDEYAFLFNHYKLQATYCPAKGAHLIEQKVNQSAEYFRILVEQSPVITYRCEWDNGPKLVYITPNVQQILGYTAHEMLHPSTFGAAQCHPDDVASLLHTIETSVKTGVGQMEHRMRHKDGTYRWLLSQWRFLPDSTEYVGHILDITERKSIEQDLADSRIQLRKLATRLNTVHEEERARMAREVHDVLGQNLTVLKFGLEHIATDLTAVDSVLNTKVDKLISVVDQTVEHVQRLSSQLRPCVLDELGLTPAIEWLVCEFTWQAEFTVELDLPDPLPQIEDNLAIVLYRVVQEALTNIVRHAKATQVKVALQITDEKAILLIQDDGCGFDATQKRTKKSMGLIGMQERIAPWDGTLDIDSTIGQGTTIYIEALLSPP